MYKMRFAGLLASVSTLAVTAAYAQTAENTPAAEGEGAGDLNEVVVTGSRIVVNGYSAPTPVTVLSTE